MQMHEKRVCEMDSDFDESDEAQSPSLADSATFNASRAAALSRKRSASSVSSSASISPPKKLQRLEDSADDDGEDEFDLADWLSRPFSSLVSDEEEESDDILAAPVKPRPEPRILTKRTSPVTVGSTASKMPRHEPSPSLAILNKSDEGSDGDFFDRSRIPRFSTVSAQGMYCSSPSDGIADRRTEMQKKWEAAIVEETPQKRRRGRQPKTVMLAPPPVPEEPMAYPESSSAFYAQNFTSPSSRSQKQLEPASRAAARGPEEDSDSDISLSELFDIPPSITRQVRVPRGELIFYEQEQARPSTFCGQRIRAFPAVLHRIRVSQQARIPGVCSYSTTKRFPRPTLAMSI